MDDARVLGLERPDPALLKQFAIQSLAGLFLAPFVFVPLFFKYHTLRYRFDADGVGVSWGILFRREIRLTYKRIQDIHVTRNVIERWLGIGTVEIQTAAGASGAEMSLLGMREHEAVRDFLYRRMRGYAAVPGDAPGDTAGDAAGGDGEALRLLREVRDELRAAREVLAARTAGSRSPRPDGGA